jgi:hypothetical protein
MQLKSSAFRAGEQFPLATRALYLLPEHCIYWGWKGVSVIQQDKYHR